MSEKKSFAEDEMAELEPGDFAVLFRTEGRVEVVQAEGGDEEAQESARRVLAFVEFVLNSDECWEMFEESEEDDGETPPDPPRVLN